MSDRPFVDRPVDDLAAARSVAVSAAHDWGLAEPELLRRGMNAIFATGDVVLRVGRPSVPAAVSIDLARHLLAAGILVPQPVGAAVLERDGLAVTAWQRIEAIEVPVDWSGVGSMVRAVHDHDPAAVPSGYPTPSPASFPWWDFDAMLADVATDIDRPALQGLVAAVERHRGWADFDRTALCHGDVHPGNVMMSSDGPVLLDWDLMCIAPPAWDHAPLLTLAERWGGDHGVYEAFADGYGMSFRDEPIAEGYAELRLVAATLMRVRAGRTDAHAHAEAERRLAFWRGEPDAPVWAAQ